ncbi:MAG: peptidylprolyl isomerase [Acidaminobacteraceae bacterium]
MQLKKRMVIILSAVLVVGALTGCSSQSATTSAASTDIVATYTQGTLPQGEFSEAILAKSGMMVMLDMVDKGILDVVEPVTDDMTINVEANAENIKSYYKDNFEESLKINGFEDEAAFLNSLYLNEQRNAYTFKYIIENNITVEEIQAYYDAFTPNIEASHILITPADETEASLAAAKEEAISLTARIADGEDFAALAIEFSDDKGSGANGGALGSFAKGAMVPEFEAAAFALKIDEVTAEPVQSQFGFHIIKKTAGEEKKSLEDMKTDIQNTLAAQKIEADQSLAFKALVQLRSENGFVISNPVIDEQYKLFEAHVTK